MAWTTLKSTPVDYPSLIGFDVSRLQAAADRWTDIQARFKQALAEYENSVRNPVTGSGWTGDASTKAIAGIQDTHAKLVATGQYVDGVVAVLKAAADGIKRAQDHAKTAAGQATGRGCTLDPATGNITDVNAAAGDWDTPAILAATDAQQAIYEARYMAFVTNAKVCPVLRYASQFGSSDTGPWQANSAANQQTAQSTASALPSDLSAIQVAPAAVPADTANPPYNVAGPGVDDHKLWVELGGASISYFQYEGWSQASSLLNHWLGNSGDAAKINPADMLKAMPHFLAEVAKKVTDEGASATAWTNYQPSDYGAIESEDWYYAFNDFRYRVITIQMVDDSGKQITEFTVGIKKPYVFHPDGKPVGPTHIPQAKIANLHTVGLAQNFITEGISHFTHTT